jgi:hypothetical protein
MTDSVIRAFIDYDDDSISNNLKKSDISSDSSIYTFTHINNIQISDKKSIMCGAEVILIENNMKDNLSVSPVGFFLLEDHVDVVNPVTICFLPPIPLQILEASRNFILSVNKYENKENV